MSPIIDLQRRLVEAGRIRAGDRANGNPRKLAEWRLTSKDRQRIEAAAGLWGGTPREWEGHPGEWELYTNTAVLPIMLLPDEKPTQWFELWSKGGCQRRCDGVHEMLTDGGCQCDHDERECKLTTRLNVLLPDLPGVGSWLISSTGENAARELLAAAELLGRASAQGVFIPARLRLEQRTKVKEGQTRRFAVPVIDIDVTLRDLLGGIPDDRQISAPATSAAGTAWTPISNTGSSSTVTLGEAITAVEQQQPHRGPRSAPPIPEVDDDIFDAQPVPVPDEDELHLPVVEQEEDPEKRSGPQTKKLNVLVGQLRDADHLSTLHLWHAIAGRRGVDVEQMIELLHGRDDEGELHWSPLRDSLTKLEASDLIERLERYQQHLGANP